jgi:putative SOS response-associated peptidase YedK
MCNLYSETKGQAAIRGLFRVQSDRTGNLPSFPGIFPDQLAPIVRNTEGGRELTLARWGMPGPSVYGGVPVTNIRNVSSPHWRSWLGPKNRCIVPATAFCEYADARPRKIPTWFALGEERPLLAFAGIWRPWRGLRGPKNAPVEGNHELFGFLTTDANATVAPIHPKAMPVILTSPEEIDLWLEGETPDALKLQRPLPNGLLRIVARGEKEDPPAKELVSGLLL